MATVWIAAGFCPPLSHPSSATDRYHWFARELVANGHRVVLFATDLDRWQGRGIGLTSRNAYRDEEAEGLIVRTFRARPYSNTFQRFVSMVDFEMLILRNNRDLPPPDIAIGVTLPPFTAHAMQILAGRYEVPFLLELGDIWPDTLVDMGELSKWHPGYWMLRALERRLYRKADRILTKLPMAKDQISGAGGDAESVVWLPNAVILDPYLADDYPPAPGPRPEFVVLYAGGLTPAYGLDRLIDAAALVAATQPELPIQFHLRGAGNLREELIAYARSLGLSNVFFPERVPQSELPGVLGQADVFVVIIRDLEVIRRFGMSANKVYEYLGAGRPIIFSVASANDPVTEAGAGISVPPEDPDAIAEAVLTLYRMSPEERRVLGRNAQEYAKAGFSLEDMSKRFVRIVEEAVDGLPVGSRVDPYDVTA